MAKALRKKGFRLFNDIAELVDGTRATGQFAFQAGQPPAPPPAPPTQGVATSAMTQSGIPIDPVLLEQSFEGRGASDEEAGHDVTQVTYIFPAITSSH
jgi:hypothetical protein